MSGDLGDRLKQALAVEPPTRTIQNGAREAAVLIPVVGRSDPKLIFTVRTEQLPSHSGQISFPGGAIDSSDDSAMNAALRESEEEIGLTRELVRVVGELDTFPTYVTGYLVTPFVGYVEGDPLLTPSPAEVAEVLAVPLSELTSAIRSDPGFVHAGRTYPTEAWVWNDHVIWGITARILRLFLRRLAVAGLAEDPGPDPWIGLVPPRTAR
jgi:8-oxo-dGTP pyrophosphatase MutT (NUDIX family)